MRADVIAYPAGVHQPPRCERRSAPAAARRRRGRAASRQLVALLLALAVGACGRPSSGIKRWPGPLLRVAAGDQSSCVIDGAGEARCWGTGLVQPPRGPFTALDVDLWGCGVRASGALACWGPGKILPPPPGVFVSVTVGHDVCAISAAGSLVCWLVSEGESCAPGPTGATVCRPHRTPPVEPLAGGQFKQVAVGTAFGAALRVDGEVQIWGSGLTADRHGKMWEPGRMVAPRGPWVEVAAGEDFVCGLAPSGSATCWPPQVLPEMEPPAGVRFAQIAARGRTACGVDDAGAVHCWGRAISWYGKTYAPPRGTFDHVSVGRAHACAHAIDGTVSCWGVDQQGQVTGEPPSLLFRN